MGCRSGYYKHRELLEVRQQRHPISSPNLKAKLRRRMLLEFCQHQDFKVEIEAEYVKPCQSRDSIYDIETTRKGEVPDRGNAKNEQKKSHWRHAWSQVGSSRTARLLQTVNWGRKSTAKTGELPGQSRNTINHVH